MKLDLASLKNRTAWDAAGVKLPEFDIPAVIENTKATPTWVHFGAGNIFRGYVCESAKSTCSIKVLLPRA